MNKQFVPHLRAPISVAAVLDGDNIFRDCTARRISPDLNNLADALSERGIQATTICQNFFKKDERDALQRLPSIYGLATRENCDKIAMLVGIEYVMAGLDWLIIGSGDADYLPLVEATQYAGTRVEVWAQRANASKSLIYAADSVRWIDDLIVALPHKQSSHSSVLAAVPGLAA